MTTTKQKTVESLSVRALETTLKKAFRQFTTPQLMTIKDIYERVATVFPKGFIARENLKGMLTEEEYELLSKWIDHFSASTQDAMAELSVEQRDELTERVRKYIPGGHIQ